MSTGHTEDSLRQLLGQAQDLPYGDTKDALLEDILRHAEATELTRLAFDVRLQQINAYAMGMTRAKMFVPFARCLAEYDHNPAEYGQWVEHTLLWSFKYAVGSMTKFPEISLDQVHGALEEMAGRYERGGHSPHAVHKYRYHVASHVGDHDAADRWYEQWCAAPRDQLSDCVACEPTSMVDYLSSRGRDAEAIAIAEPVLGQQLTCEAQPQAILSTLLWPYARTGHAAEARAAHRRAYRLLRTRPQDLDDLADHVLFCACTGNEARGMELLERHIGWLDRASSPFHGMRFAATCALLLRRVTESGLGTMRILRPGHGDRPAEELTVAALGAELTAYAYALAARFDERNGTTHQTERMRTLIATEPVAEHIPLSVVTPSRPVPSAAPEPDWTGRSAAEIVDQGEQSLSHGDEAAAAVALRKLTELTNDDADPVLLGRIAALRGRLDLTDGEADFRRAAELFAAGGDESRRQSVLGRLGALLSQRDRADEGMPLQRAALAYFQQTGDAESEVWTSLRLAGSLVILSDVDESAKLLDRATELAAGLDDDLIPGALAWARVDLCGSDADAAIVATDEALRLFQQTGMARMIAGAHFRLSGLWRATGDPERGLTHAEQAVAHLPATSPSDMRATLLVAHGDVLVQLERPAEAVPVLLAAVSAALDSDDGYLVASTRRALALAYRDAGQLLDASDVAEEAIAGFDAAGDHHSANGMRYLLAKVQVALNEPDSALALYTELVASSRAHGTLGGLPQVLTDTADLLDRLDRDALAAQRYREAGDAAEAAGDPYRTAYCRYQEALSLLWSGRREDALTVLAEAEQTVAALPGDSDGARTWHEAQLASNAVRILRSADRLPEAVANAERALALFTELDERTRVIGAQLMLGDVLLRSERAAEAEPVLRAALAAVTSQGGRSQHIAETLATALDQLGRDDEATEIRAAAGIQQT